LRGNRSPTAAGKALRTIHPREQLHSCIPTVFMDVEIMGLRTIQLLAGAPPLAVQHGRQTVVYRGRREIMTLNLTDPEWEALFGILEEGEIKFICDRLELKGPALRTPQCQRCPCFREDLPDTCSLHSQPHLPEWQAAYKECGDPERPEWDPQLQVEDRRNLLDQT